MELRIEMRIEKSEVRSQLSVIRREDRGAQIKVSSTDFSKQNEVFAFRNS